MGRIGGFEELIAWQKARELVREVYKVTREGRFSRDRSLVGQIQRSAVSVMSNIAEGFERGGRGEFHQFLAIAKGSCGEVRSQLYVALDVGYMESSTFECLRGKAEEVSKIIGALRAAVERQRDSAKGPK